MRRKVDSALEITRGLTRAQNVTMTMDRLVNKCVSMRPTWTTVTTTKRRCYSN